jgi:hypothetical protein
VASNTQNQQSKTTKIFLYYNLNLKEMNVHTFIIPEKSERYLDAFESIIRKHGTRFSKISTKDGTVYEIEFDSSDLMDNFKIAVSQQIPNLY